jgi:hypothetical protein
MYALVFPNITSTQYQIPAHTEDVRSVRLPGPSAEIRVQAYMCSRICDAIQPPCSVRLVAPSKAWKCASGKTKTTLILSSKCSKLCKPIHLKPMSAHCVILVLGRRASVSPAPSDFIETWKNHYKDIRCSRTYFSCHLIILCMKNKLNLTTLYTIHTRALRSRRLFHCAPKTLWQRPRIKFWEGNECGWWCMVDILIPIHIARCAQADVCAGIRVTIENRRSIYQ